MDKVTSIESLHITHWHKVDCPNCGWVNMGLASSALLVACPICDSPEAICFYSGHGRSNHALPWIQPQKKEFVYGSSKARPHPDGKTPPSGWKSNTEGTVRLSAKMRSALAAL